MQLYQKLNIVFPACNNVDHSQALIVALCLNGKCNQNPAQCFQCSLKLHRDCMKHIIMLENIPMLIKIQWQLEQDLIELQQMDICSIEKLSSIQSILKPISDYIDDYGITTLNQLGVFLKKDQSEIFNLFVEAKNECSAQNLKEDHQCIAQQLIEDFQMKCQIALQSYQQELKKSKSNTLVDLYRGNVLSGLGKYEEAIIYYSEVINRESKNYYALLQKGKALHQLQKFKAAMKIYEQAIIIDIKKYQAWLYKGLLLFKLKQCQRAIECYDRAFERAPENQYYYILMCKGSALSELKQYFKAIDFYHQANQYIPDTDEFYFNKGSALVKLNYIEEGVDCFLAFRDTSKNNFNQLSFIGNALFEAKQFNQAIACFELALLNNPKFVPALDSIGVSLLIQRKFNEAAKYLKKSIAIDPKNSTTLNNIGVLLLINYEFEQAILYFSEEIKINPLSYQAWNNKGFALLFQTENLFYYITNVQRRGSHCLLQIINKDKQQLLYCVEQFRYFQTVFQGGTLLEMNLYEEAILKFTKAIKLNPNSPESWLNKGDALNKIHRFKEAQNCFEQTIKLSTEEFLTSQAWLNQDILINKTQGKHYINQISMKKPSNVLTNVK